jgi:hypothetical protein
LRVSGDQPKGRILYLKGRFLPTDTPGIDEQRAFDQKLLAAGIVDAEGRGPHHAELKDVIRRLKVARDESSSAPIPARS